jgi:hypothetical protein
LNVYVPTLLIPVAADVAIVAPVIAHVNLFTPQLSAVVGLGVTTDALQVAPVVVIIFAGQEIVGRAVSVIVTVNEQVALLFAASRTVYVTVVTPLLKVYVPTLLIPVAGDVAIVVPVIAQVNNVAPQLSAVVGLGVTIDAVHAAPTVPVILAGQLIVGTILSTTVTVKLHELVLPLPSVALWLTVVTPTGKLAPEAGPAVRTTGIQGYSST